jgi:putative iron-only hydrogenase system regulator
VSTRIHTVTITILDRNAAFRTVGEILHNFAESIKLRVGYPMQEHNAAVIFLVVELTTDEMGALSGRLGQIPSVKVKATPLPV